MTSQSKFRLVLVIFMAVLVLGGGGLFALYRFWPAPTTQVNQTNQVIGNTHTLVDNTNGITNTNANINTNTNTTEVVNAPLSEPAPDEIRVRSLAQSFTERYGSYSNQNQYENLIRLYTYMSVKLQKETQAYITQQGVQNTSTYAGVTTTVISVAVEKLEADKAVVTVTTRRRESKEGQSASTSSQQARLVMVKVDGKWLVDKFDWQ